MKSRPLFLAVALVPALASAHPGHDGDHDFGWDFTGGLTHPLFGWDHLLAMIAVGLWAARLGGRAQWQLPLAFVATLSIGTLSAQAGLALPGVEPFIAASLVGLGCLLAFASSMRVTFAAPLVALFAFAHGFAHGTELPASGALPYFLGFLVASLGLHAVGVGLGRSTSRLPNLTRVVGAGIAVAGTWALAS